MGYSSQGHSSHREFISLGIHPMGLSSLGGLIFRAIRLRGLLSRGIFPGGSQTVKNRPRR